MTDSDHKSNGVSITVKLTEFIKNLPTDQQQGLLNELQARQQRVGRDFREHTRKNVSVISDYAVGDHAFMDFIQNISAGGAFIQTTMPFSIGQAITITFLFPGNEEPIKITGEIVRNNSQGIGLKFNTANQALKDMLKNL